MQVLAADHASSPASPLRVVHRGVGRGDHIIGGLEAIRTSGDANADGRDEPVCPDLVGCSEQLAEALSDHKDRLCRSDLVEEHDEVIATHSGGGVAGPQRDTKARRHIDEKLIAGRISQRVVHSP